MILCFQLSDGTRYGRWLDGCPGIIGFRSNFGQPIPVRLTEAAV